MELKGRSLFIFLGVGGVTFLCCFLLLEAASAPFRAAVEATIKGEMNILSSAWVRGSVAAGSWPISIKFEIPNRYLLGGTLPLYGYSWPLFMALLMPSMAVPLRSRLIHAAVGFVIFFFAFHLHLLLLWAQVHVSGSGEGFMKTVFGFPLDMVITFSKQLGPTVGPIVYWFCLYPFGNEDKELEV